MERSPEIDSLISKTRGLIYGRLALIFMLMLAGWWWTSNYLELSADSFPIRLFILFLIAIALTLLYLFLLRFDSDYLWQIRAQLIIDILLISWLVSETGGYMSPYVTLYIVLISVAGYSLIKSETIVVSILSALGYSVVSFLSRDSLFYSSSAEIPASRFLQTVAFNTVGILIVGLLAGHLSERRIVSRKLKETEESFDDLNILHERIVESIPTGLITTDIAGKIRTVNRAAAVMTGYTSAEAKGESIYRLFADDIRNSVELCLQRASEQRKFPAAHFESAISSRSNGGNPEHDATVACIVAPLVARSGMVNGLLISFQDISKIRAMEESLRQSDRLAAVGRMAAGLAHEIRNPLGSMSSAMQFLEEHVKPETADANLLGVVLRESDRLNEIITNFLTYAQLSGGKAEKQHLEPTDVRAAINDCLLLLKHSRELGDSIEINAELPDEPATIMANETQIKQVLWNLAQNAINAMPEGGTLDITLAESSSDESVSIVFKDSGCGITPEKIDRLYEPFTGSSKGAGLGLSIVHGIVRDHGGIINVESKVSEGTAVTIRFPR
ncbi:MAG: PAS domain S-box protein [Pyrinomonadaceae bacterium]|nr:PAS domain S-box protein [Pyrinomonadaceae bacterium]